VRTRGSTEDPQTAEHTSSDHLVERRLQSTFLASWPLTSTTCNSSYLLSLKVGLYLTQTLNCSPHTN